MAENRITLLPSGEVFTVRDKELVLDAAIRQGIGIVYSCRNGTCRTCLVQVRDGRVIQTQPELCMITEPELEMGRRLVCMSTAASDAVLEKVVPRRRRAAEASEP